MADRYWVPTSPGNVSTGNWNSTNTANWSATSGGSPGASAPVSGDDVYFDAGSDSGAGFTVTVTATGPTVRNLTISGLDQAMILAGSTAFAVQGNISLPASNFTWSATGSLNLTGSASSRTILTNGVTINSLVNFNSAGSDWTLQSALTLGSTRNFVLTNGSVDTAGYAVTAQSVSTSGTTTRSLTLGASTVTCGGTTPWDLAATTNLTFSAGTSNIILTRATAKTFAGGGLTYNIVSQGGAGALTISGSNTFADIQNPYSATGATSIIFTAGTTQTVSAFTASGEAGRVLTIESTSAGSAATLSKASGTVTVSHCSIKDSTATGGATWVAVSSTDVSGNTGWTFQSGAEVDVPASGVAVAVYAPTIATGASVAVPLASVALAAFAPTVASGVNVQFPVSSVAVAAYAPSVGSGTLVTVPASTIAVTVFAPTITIAAGVTIDVPISTLSVTTHAPTLTTSTLSTLPRVTLTGRFILAAI
jgi:hypothetical protein